MTLFSYAWPENPAYPSTPPVNGTFLGMTKLCKVDAREQVLCTREMRRRKLHFPYITRIFSPLSGKNPGSPRNSDSVLEETSHSWTRRTEDAPLFVFWWSMYLAESIHMLISLQRLYCELDSTRFDGKLQKFSLVCWFSRNYIRWSMH